MYQWISKKLMIVVVLAGVVLLTSVMMADEAPKPAKNVTWEYKVIDLNEPALNALGREGWECMSVVPNITGNRNARGDGVSKIQTTLTAVMKRQIK